MKLVIDIGGTKTEFGVFDEKSNLLRTHTISTPVHNRSGLIDEIKSESSRLAQSNEIFTQVNISIAGTSNPESAQITSSNVPAIAGLGFKDDLENALSTPCQIANDASCYALAEAHKGIGRNHAVVLGIILGSGIGGGIVINGSLLPGLTGIAGELGHSNNLAARMKALEIVPEECDCGAGTCLDVYGAGIGLNRLHMALTNNDLPAKEILSLWDTKDDTVLKTVEIFMDLVSDTLAQIVNFIDPHIVPITGGLSNSQKLIESLDRVVRAKTLAKLETPLIVPSTLKGNGCLLGAAMLPNIAI